MGWTGGQYSLYRAALSVVVGVQLFASAREIASGASGFVGPLVGRPLGLVLFAAAGLVAAGLVTRLAFGARDRLAAWLLAPAIVVAEVLARPAGSVPDVVDVLAGRTALLPALLLLLHARTPEAPFGAWDARTRTDPRGDWQRPAGQGAIGWALLGVVLLASVVRTGGLGMLGFGGAGDVAGGSTGPGGALAAGSGDTSSFGSLAARALLVVLACEPARWRGRRLAPGDATRHAPGPTTTHEPAGPRPARLFYDGDCGFCHRSVRFILSEELATPTELRLRFAPLGSDTFRACLARHPELDGASLPDSIVLELEDGLVLTRSAAALEIASRLGGFWRGLALVGRLVPGPLLDAGYDGIARIRKRLFAQPKDACPILPPDLRARFDS